MIVMIFITVKNGEYWLAADRRYTNVLSLEGFMGFEPEPIKSPSSPASLKFSTAETRRFSKGQVGAVGLSIMVSFLLLADVPTMTQLRWLLLSV